MQRNPSSRRPPVQRMTQQPKQVVLPSPRKKQLGTKQSKRGIQLPR